MLLFAFPVRAFQVVLARKSFFACLGANQMKAIEQYFFVIVFIMLYKVVINLECVSETFKCDRSSEIY